MKILIACEMSGVVRDAFASLRHDAWSCDILPSERPGQHLMMDIFDAIAFHGPWDAMIGFPPCTFVCSSGLHWNGRIPGRSLETERAVHFFRNLIEREDPPKIALENPIGCLSTRFRKPDQIIQPWKFGEDASKGTCLWLKGLPLLKPTSCVAPRIVNGKKRWANQTDSGQNKLAPSNHRAADRSRTYQGIGLAMAEQWG